MRYLLDTSALLSHYRQESGGQKVQQLFESEDAELLLASISIAEFGRRLRELGASESDIDEALAAYQLLFSEVVAIDTEIAKAAFVISCRTSSRIPLIDSLIAASAQSKQAQLVHRDEHMRTIPSTFVQQFDLGR